MLSFVHGEYHVTNETRIVPDKSVKQDPALERNSLGQWLKPVGGLADHRNDCRGHVEVAIGNLFYVAAVSVDDVFRTTGVDEIVSDGQSADSLGRNQRIRIHRDIVAGLSEQVRLPGTNLLIGCQLQLTAIDTEWTFRGLDADFDQKGFIAAADKCDVSDVGSDDGDIGFQCSDDSRANVSRSAPRGHFHLPSEDENASENALDRRRESDGQPSVGKAKGDRARSGNWKKHSCGPTGIVRDAIDDARCVE